MPSPGHATERVTRTEAALRASQALKSAIFAIALDCIVTIDHAGRVVDFNPAAKKTFGYTSEEALGREMAELIIPPQLREQHRVGLRRALASGRDTIVGQRIEITAMRRTGEEFPVELAITRIDVEGGSPIFTGHIRDITERKAAEVRRATQLAVTRVLAETPSIRDAAPRILQAVCESLRWDPATAAVPFIFLTAKGEKTDLRTGMNLGADDYLAKPVSSDELVTAVNARFARQRAPVQGRTEQSRPFLMSGSKSTESNHQTQKGLIHEHTQPPRALRAVHSAGAWPHPRLLRRRSRDRRSQAHRGPDQRSQSLFPGGPGPNVEIARR